MLHVSNKNLNMVINMSTPWTKEFLSKYFQTGGKTPRCWHNETKKVEKQYMLAKQELCLFS